MRRIWAFGAPAAIGLVLLGAAMLRSPNRPTSDAGSSVPRPRSSVIVPQSSPLGGPTEDGELRSTQRGHRLAWIAAENPGSQTQVCTIAELPLRNEEDAHLIRRFALRPHPPEVRYQALNRLDATAFSHLVDDAMREEIVTEWRDHVREMERRSR